MQMIESVAQATGVDLATAVSHDRNLVIAGLRTKGGRGTSAAQMTASDGAHLLIAVACADQVRGSAETTKNFAQLGAHHVFYRSPILGFDHDHTFGEALTSIIAAYIRGGIRRDMRVTIDVQINRTERIASIEGAIDTNKFNMFYRRPGKVNHDPPRLPRILIEARFNEETLAAIAESLNK